MYSDAIGWGHGGAVRVLDQTALPDRVRYDEVDSVDGMVDGLRALRVRGAPLIGIAAAMALAAEAGRVRVTREWLDRAAARLSAARPTAVNLSWAVERMRRAGGEALAQGASAEEIARRLRAEAQAIWDEDAEMCQRIGAAGAELVPEGATVLTHCNTGKLATGGIGTAFGVIHTAHRLGKGIDVVACEARPLGQGARLTAWELTREGIPGRVIVDGAAAWLMAQGDVDLVITGADRIAANGDVANKIGTYALALLARAHGIPFLVAAPRTTIDPALASGDLIPIEERAASEILGPRSGVAAYNPAFDVTPAELVSAIITDQGVLTTPYHAAIETLTARAAGGASGPS